VERGRPKRKKKGGGQGRGEFKVIITEGSPKPKKGGWKGKMTPPRILKTGKGERVTSGGRC